MNKIIPTSDHVFMSMVGPSGSGKSQLIYDMLLKGTFQPKFNKILYFYQHFQPLYEEMLTTISNIEFIQCLDFEMIDQLPNDGTKYLLIFDDSCSELFKSPGFEKIATSGRHKNLNVIYIKHNLFHKGKIGRDTELQNTHIVLFKSPRDTQQISRLGQQLGIATFLKACYNDATTKPFGHLMIDLSPKTVDSLRYSSDIASYPTKFYLPTSKARVTLVDDAYTKRAYSPSLRQFYNQTETDDYIARF